MSTASAPAEVPRLLVLTDRAQCAAAGRTLRDTVTAAVRAGAPAVLLREKDLPHRDRRDLARTLVEVTSAHGADLFVAGDPHLARTVGAAGVHLAGDDPLPDPTRDRADLLVGRSCHDAIQVAAAVAEGVDYVTVSPFAPTPSKPGYGPALGPDGVAALTAAAAPVPVLALGGITPANADAALASGADGLAVMGAVMQAADPGRVVAGCLDLLAERNDR